MLVVVQLPANIFHFLLEKNVRFVGLASGLLSLCPRFNLRIWFPAWSYSERQAAIFDFHFLIIVLSLISSLFRFHSFPLLTLTYITISFVFSFRFEA